MKLILSQRSRRSNAGILLIECLVYIAVVALVFQLAVTACFKCLEYSRDLQRNAEDITRALKAGELWRADIRKAVAVRQGGADNMDLLEVQQAGGVVRYWWEQGKVWRDGGDGTGGRPFLSGVESSTMSSDTRNHVVAWNWNLELKTRRPAARVHPLFSFASTPSKPPSP